MTTAEQIAALNSALARGVLEVTDADGRSVRYANPADLRKQLDRLNGETATATAGLGMVYRKLVPPGTA